MAEDSYNKRMRKKNTNINKDSRAVMMKKVQDLIAKKANLSHNKEKERE